METTEYCYQPRGGFLGSMAGFMAMLSGRAFAKHDFVSESFGRRVCKKCGQHQMLTQKRFVEAGEASLNWRDTWRESEA